jgi:hypothetical protein
VEQIPLHVPCGQRNYFLRGVPASMYLDQEDVKVTFKTFLESPTERIHKAVILDGA